MAYIETTAIFLIAYGMAAIIARRCFNVLFNMDLSAWHGPYWKFFGFGLSYALLMIAAFGGALSICSGDSEAGYWFFMASSTGLILFDRRSRVPKGMRNDSDRAAVA